MECTQQTIQRDFKVWHHPRNEPSMEHSGAHLECTHGVLPLFMPPTHVFKQERDPHVFTKEDKHKHTDWIPTFLNLQLSNCKLIPA